MKPFKSFKNEIKKGQFFSQLAVFKRHSHCILFQVSLSIAANHVSSTQRVSGKPDMLQSILLRSVYNLVKSIRSRRIISHVTKIYKNFHLPKKSKYWKTFDSPKNPQNIVKLLTYSRKTKIL